MDLRLPPGYRKNPPASDDSTSTYWDADEVRLADQWQAHVYRLAQGLAGGRTVVDIGCGTGGKLAKYVAPVASRCIGIDQSSGIAVARAQHPDGEWVEADLREDAAWDHVRSFEPDLVICSDVIEHVPDPVGLLRRLRSLGGRLLISTPDRSILPGASAEGPPASHLHIREWTADEFRRLLGDSGLEVVEHHHFPARGDVPPLLAARMALWRVLHGRGLRAPRSCMAFLCEAGPAATS